MKKIIFMMITVLGFVLCMGISSSAAEYKGFEYNVLENGKIEIVSYKGDKEEVTIPSKINKKTVIKIGSDESSTDAIFDHNCETRIVHIPSTIKEIDFFAFGRNVEKVFVDEKNKYYSSDENGVLYDKGKTEIVMFSEANRVETYYIPKTLKKVSFFDFNENVKYIYVEKGNKKFASDDNGVLFNKKMTKLICYPQGNDREQYSVPEGVTVIGDYAFYCSLLKQVDLPKSLNKIGKEAFYNSNITSFTFGSKVKSIDASAFDSADLISFIKVSPNNKYFSNDEHGTLFNKNKTKLIKYPVARTDEKYIIPEGTVSVSANAFEDAGSLKDILFPESLRYVGSSAFSGTGWLGLQPGGSVYAGKVLLGVFVSDEAQYPSALKIAEGTKAIADRAFYGEDIKSVVFPKSLEIIGKEAFTYCDYLEDVILPSGVSNVGQDAFAYCNSIKTLELTDTIYKDYDNIFGGSNDVKDIDLIITEENANIGDSFNNEKIKNIVFTDNVKTIEKEGFINCTSLNEINLTDNITVISESAFAGCTALSEIEIPKNVKKIDNSAFFSKSIKKLTVVPENKYFSSKDGILYNKNKTVLISYPQNRKNKAFTVPSTVKRIEACAFEWCSNLEKIVISKNVKAIGTGNFHTCNKLNYIEVSKKNKYFASKDGCLYSKDYKTLLKVPVKLKKAYVTMHPSMVYIDYQAYDEHCTALILSGSGEKIEPASCVSFYKSAKLSKSKYKYDGKFKRPKVTIYDNYNNKLEEGTDYKLKYSSGRKKPGKYWVKVILEDTRYGDIENKVYFKIVKK